MSDKILRDPEVAAMTGLGRTKRWQMERNGRFPRRRLICAGRVGWLESEVLEWMRNLEVGAPPAPKAAMAARGVASAAGQ